MENPWTLFGIGVLFCATGVYYFYKNAFEEDKRLLQPILMVIAGVILIGLGMAKIYHVKI